MEEKKVLAVDLGASSGRVMLAAYDGTRIRVEELHRFSNDPVLLGGTMYWDFLRLFYELKQGILKAKDFGPVEATVYGNAVIQLMADGSIAGIEEGRRLIRASEDIRRYEPGEGERWEEAYEKYRRLLDTWRS